MSDPNISGGGGKDARTYGFIDGTWQNQPILYGYSGLVEGVKSNLNSPAGSHTLVGTAVPAGEIWLLHALHARNVNTNPSIIYIQVYTLNTFITLKQVSTPGLNVFVSWQGFVAMNEGSTLRASFSGCTLNDDLHLRWLATRVDIE